MLETLRKMNQNRLLCDQCQHKETDTLKLYLEIDLHLLHSNHVPSELEVSRALKLLEEEMPHLGQLQGNLARATGECRQMDVSLFILTHVCSRCRSIIIGCPRLWASIRINISSRLPTGSVKLVETFLANLAGYPPELGVFVEEPTTLMSGPRNS
ncbi:hypothetical protein L218DRAFT_762843 [Marasmius fiardii PR-910]|nr:hypothetical protein L218DRAFT_762843 [Marasmius fiardii PR-910]